MLVEGDAAVCPTQQFRQRGLSLLDESAPEIVAKAQSSAAWSRGR
jgi:hypothetical protein